MTIAESNVFPCALIWNILQDMLSEIFEGQNSIQIMLLCVCMYVYTQ